MTAARNLLACLHARFPTTSGRLHSLTLDGEAFLVNVWLGEGGALRCSTFKLDEDDLEMDVVDLVDALARLAEAAA